MRRIMRRYESDNEQKNPERIYCGTLQIPDGTGNGIVFGTKS